MSTRLRLSIFFAALLATTAAAAETGRLEEVIVAAPRAQVIEAPEISVKAPAPLPTPKLEFKLELPAPCIGAAANVCAESTTAAAGQ